MIFYFSGTGNSLFVAKRLLGKEEQLINIGDSIREGNFSFKISNNESLGFVFPVYFYTVPAIVKDFIEKLELINTPSYVYGIITCGGSISQAGVVLKKCLETKNINLNYLNHVLMPDNSMLFYQIPGPDKAEERLKNAEELCLQIKKDIDEKKSVKLSNNSVISNLIGLGYKACMNTKKFYADDLCISCGLCERNCPEKVIELKEGKPVWVKEKCTKCSSCINRCPVHAIQYGNGTQKRNRYVIPRD